MKFRSAEQTTNHPSVVDRLKILVGLGQTEGHAEHTLQLGFTAQQKPEACFLDDIVSGG